MPIRVVCPCGAELTLRDEAAGRTFKCPKCGGPFTVGGSEWGGNVVSQAPPLHAGETVPNSLRSTRSPATDSRDAVDRTRRRRAPVALLALPMLVLPAVWLAWLVLSVRTGGAGDPVNQAADNLPEDEAPIQRRMQEARESVARIEQAQQTGDYRGVEPGFNPQHPDYGGIIWLTLIQKAGKKVVPGRGLKWWLDHLTAEQRDAVLLNCVKCGIGSRGLEDLVVRGWADRIPELIELLNREIATASALAVATALEDLLPHVRLPQEFDDEHDTRQRWLTDDAEAMDVALEGINQPLESIRDAFGKDVDHYFYKRWIKAGRGVDWLDWE